jgi:uncharacterized membrane protein
MPFILLENTNPVFTDDTIVFGLLTLVLGFVFYTSKSSNKFWKTFYKYIPALLMCYMLPAVLNTMGIISSDVSKTYSMAKNYLLPTALVLMTLSIDLKAVFNLGPKALIMFLTATVGVVIGGPLAIMLVATVSPETVGGEGFDAVWRGLATLAGSWIGGGANQAAMLEIYKYNDDYYASMVLVDIVVANIWMAFLLLGVGANKRIDKWLKADSSSIEALKNKVEKFAKSIERNPTLSDLMIILGIGFGVTSLSHFLGGQTVDLLKGAGLGEGTLTNNFFWLIVYATTIGLVLSFTKARNYEGAGASKIGSVFVYILVATIGMKMDILQIADNPGIIVVGLIWMAIHVGLLFIVAKIIRAPYFFLAVGSKANIGGAASAPVVAAAFHPSLASVGVLLAVLGYALGTYAAIFCAELMSMVAP